MNSSPPAPAELLVAASHAEISTEIGRWLIHDIRGPLQGVSLTLALVAEPDSPPLDAELRDSLAAASRELEVIVALMDRLLRIPRLQSERGPVSLGDVLRDAVRFAERRRVRLQIDWPATDAVAALPPVALDADQLLHVLLAALVFATRASGGTADGRIVVTLEPGAENIVIRFIAAAAAAGVSRPIADDDVRVAGSRALLERAGGALSVTSSDRGTTLAARLPVWRSSVS